MNSVCLRLAFGLALITVTACEKPSAPAPPDPFLAKQADWENELSRLEAARTEELRRLETLNETGQPAARLREGLEVEKGLLLQARKTLVTVRELLEAPGDKEAARLEATSRVTAALQSARVARSQNESLWVPLEVERAKRQAVPEKKTDPPEKKEE